jgi:hypothetical protein
MYDRTACPVITAHRVGGQAPAVAILGPPDNAIGWQGLL